jgi:hypothetical protein
MVAIIDASNLESVSANGLWQLVDLNVSVWIIARLAGDDEVADLETGYGCLEVHSSERVSNPPPREPAETGSQTRDINCHLRDAPG